MRYKSNIYNQLNPRPRFAIIVLIIASVALFLAGLILIAHGDSIALSSGIIH